MDIHSCHKEINLILQNEFKGLYYISADEIYGAYLMSFKQASNLYLQ